MDAGNVIEALRRMRNYGFELRVAASVAAAPPSKRNLFAIEAAASVLYNVDVDAFGEGGNWEPVGRHVQRIGLREMSKVDAAELALNVNEVAVAAVNAAIAFAAEILELAEAQPS
ncbi:hypothetical protein [Paraburkholderia sp. BL17N1]|uniref:hypothetical protein n=1 Tax=Paraburkholderia sp. BL17N1 TaxID=1938798 RepID=UPI000EB1E2B5|nr:hypothetical protein [Paraburkholderia sp. BL17N1]RKR31697.1 hypothetical protein B0G82_7935 [Paraburkholderia sp. BL17N1]